MAVHLAVLFPTLFRALLLDSAVATSATGDRLGEARLAALKQWRKDSITSKNIVFSMIFTTFTLIFADFKWF